VVNTTCSRLPQAFPGAWSLVQPIGPVEWRLARDRQTFLRIAYLLLAFPLGTLYFVVIITGG